jgi:hypothetical protein
LGGLEDTSRSFPTEVIVPNKALYEGGIQVKNTGKRIFFAVVVAALANAALIVSAGAFASQR